MFFAHDENGIRIEAAPSRSGYCPSCGDALQAKCGAIRVWHWAHLSKLDCDPWAESESEWHLSWKRLAPLDRVEVSRGPHRADIVGGNGTVVELQHSAISQPEILAREEFYGQMVWLIDGEPFQGQLRVELDNENPTFTWAHARPCWRAARKPLFVHGFSVGRYVNAVDRATGRIMRTWSESYASREVLQIRSISWRKQVEGVCRIIKRDRFVERIITGL